MSPAQPTRHLEIETKLEIDPSTSIVGFESDKQLRSAGTAGVEAPVVHDLDAVYFDTEDLHLLQAKLTLRRRIGGEDSGWHLKLPAIAGARTEIAVPLSDGDERSVPAALRDLIAGAARGLPLRPVGRIRNHRTVHRTVDAAGTRLVEVADDQVTATAIAADGTESTPAQWRELEAELLDGTLRHLEATVTALTKRGATPASSSSKLARALAETGAHRPTPPPSKKDRSAGTAVITAVQRLHAAWIATDRAVREGTPTALHDARAATRRLRSVLGVYAALFEQEPVQQLRNRLAEHSRTLGTARDLEVIRDRLDAQLIEEPTEYARAAAARLTIEFERRIPAAVAETLEHLHSDDYFALIRDLDAFLAAPPVTKRASRPATSELPALLGTAWHRLGEHVDNAAADPGDSNLIHLVRRRTKALRYATEAAGPVIGDDAVVFAAALEAVQEVLGEFQDSAISAELLADLALDPGTDGTAGFVFGRLHAFEQAVGHGCLDDFADAWDRVADGELVTFLGR